MFLPRALAVQLRVALVAQELLAVRAIELADLALTLLAKVHSLVPRLSHAHVFEGVALQAEHTVAVDTLQRASLLMTRLTIH